ncbi:lipopolysaccharide biosynthesis protein [Candidatus Parcubacteria bacterium]|nr:lipopolysaccharide biosynthesis protein [Candidatus Parcubacteria bacterium]
MILIKNINNILNKYDIINFLESTDGSLYQKTMRGGFWIFSLRVITRLLNLVKLIVLARLLSPSDFGLFGIALLSLSILETFSQTGFNRALIQKKGDISSYLDSVWTAGIIRGIIIAIILFFTSPYIAIFFDVPEVVPILRTIGLVVIIKSFVNIAIIYFQKELEFKKYFQYQFLGSLSSAVVTISVAIIFQSVWALVFGLLAGSLIRLLMSYRIDSYRPKIRIDLQKLKELWGFGKWVMGSSMLVFLITHGDDIFVGKLLGVTALGFYQFAYSISNAPATGITHVISKITFPAYSKLQDDIPRLRKAYLKVLSITTLFSFPIAGLIFILASDFTMIFLGEKWMPMVPAMQVLCLWGLIRSIGATTGPVFQAVGKPKIVTKLQLFVLILLMILIYPLAIKWGILGVATAVILSSMLPNIAIFVIITKLIRCKLFVFVKMIMLPLISSMGLVLSIVLLRNIIIETNVISFIAFVAAGLLFYVLLYVQLGKLFNYKKLFN